MSVNPPNSIQVSTELTAIWHNLNNAGGAVASAVIAKRDDRNAKVQDLLGEALIDAQKVVESIQKLLEVPPVR